MIKSYRLIILRTLLFVVAGQNAFSQVILQDSAFSQAALSKTIVYFNSAVGAQSKLYNGAAYYFHDPVITGTAYFLDPKTATSGSVYYDGSRYVNIPMFYDLYSDDLAVASYYDAYTMFSLLKERVKEFNVLNHHFINVNADTIVNNRADLKSGYYDEVYKGKIAVLIRRIKKIEAVPGSLEQKFYQYDVVYLLKNNKYHIITGKGAMLDALHDKKKELQHYIDTNNIKFGKASEEAVVKIAAYYDYIAN